MRDLLIHGYDIIIIIIIIIIRDLPPLIGQSATAIAAEK